MSDSTSKTISIRIAIDIPVDIAADTLAKLQPVIQQLAHPAITGGDQNQQEASAADEEEEARQAEIKQHYQNNIREFERKGVQAYRLFRRIIDGYDKPSAAHREIAYKLNWPVGVVPSVISNRRKKVGAYIKRRRMATALRLARKGYSNQRIADRFGVSQGTANRILRDARASLKGGANA